MGCVTSNKLLSFWLIWGWVDTQKRPSEVMNMYINNRPLLWYKNLSSKSFPTAMSWFLRGMVFTQGCPLATPNTTGDIWYKQQWPRWWQWFNYDTSGDTVAWSNPGNVQKPTESISVWLESNDSNARVASIAWHTFHPSGVPRGTASLCPFQATSWVVSQHPKKHHHSISWTESKHNMTETTHQASTLSWVWSPHETIWNLSWG